MNVLIAEDEAPAARRLERMVAEQLGPRLTQIAVAPTLDTARAALAGGKVDLLLLDLDLAGADGFALLGSGPRQPRIVVVSAHADRAIDAFDHAVIDFVAKPVAADRLARALERALDGTPLTPGAMSLVVRSAGRIDLAKFSDIVALSGADDYVEVTLADGRRFLHDTRLQELERRLPSGFVRVHRSHIANGAHVRGVRSLAGGRRMLELSGGAEIPVSRNRVGEIQSLLREA